MTFHAGALLADVPWRTSNGVPSSNYPAPDAFGYLNHLDSLLFTFMQSLPNDGFLKDLINYVLASSSSAINGQTDLRSSQKSGIASSLPPPNSTSYPALFASLPSLPLIEVELWGGLPPSAIDHIVSSFTGPSSSSSLSPTSPSSSDNGNATMIFGQATGDALRSWVHTTLASTAAAAGGQQKSIRWALNATSPDYALDDGQSSTFQAIWDSSRSATTTTMPSSAQQMYERLRGGGLLST